MDIEKYLQRSGGTNWYNVPYVTKQGDTLSSIRGMGDVMTPDQYTTHGGESKIERFLVKEGGRYGQNSAFMPGSTLYIATNRPETAKQILSMGSGGGIDRLDSGRDFIGANAQQDVRLPVPVAASAGGGQVIPGVGYRRQAPTEAISQVPINRGDTLGALAKRYGTTVQALVEANRGNTGALPNPNNPNLILAGGMLRIPGMSLSSDSMQNDVKQTMGSYSSSKSTTSITSEGMSGDSMFGLPQQGSSIAESDAAYASGGVAMQSAEKTMKLYEQPETKESRLVDRLREKRFDSLEELTGRGAFQSEQERQQGVQQKKQELLNAQAEIQSKRVEYEAIKARYVSILNDVENKPITMQSIQGSQQNERRKLEGELLVKSSEIARAEASAYLTQGNVSLAQDAADRAVKLKYQDAIDNASILGQQIETMLPTLDKQDKIWALKVKDASDQRKTALEARRDVEKLLLSEAINSRNKYPSARIQLGDSQDVMTQKILNSDEYKLEIAKAKKDAGTSGENTPKVENINGVPSSWNFSKQAWEPITLPQKPSTPQDRAQIETNIREIEALKTDKRIRNAVGPSFLGRFIGRGADALTGAKSNYIASVEQLVSQLTLDSLIQAKEKGATFGALSDAELRILASSASKIGTWRKTDKSGNVTHYNASEKSFKAELDKISNFAKLDYVLKGGNPSSIGVQIMGDGSYWTTNSDGDLTKLRDRGDFNQVGNTKASNEVKGYMDTIPLAQEIRVEQIVNAIKQVESGGNYKAQGASGEGGAFQFMPSTWKQWAGEYLGNPSAPMTPQNQETVARSKVNALLKQGYNEREIALIWNGGTPKVKKGVNQYGVPYDSGAYAEKVLRTLQRKT